MTELKPSTAISVLRLKIFNISTWKVMVAFTVISAFSSLLHWIQVDSWSRWCSKRLLPIIVNYIRCPFFYPCSITSDFLGRGHRLSIEDVIFKQNKSFHTSRQVKNGWKIEENRAWKYRSRIRCFHDQHGLISAVAVEKIPAKAHWCYL